MQTAAAAPPVASAGPASADATTMSTLLLDGTRPVVFVSLRFFMFAFTIVATVGSCDTHDSVACFFQVSPHRPNPFSHSWMSPGACVTFFKPFLLLGGTRLCPVWATGNKAAEPHACEGRVRRSGGI